jgi:predicted dehydrogenase
MRVAVIGAGGNGTGKINVLKQCPQVGSIIAVDVREQRVREVTTELGVEATTDLRQVLDDPRVELVFISSSNDAHRELALASLEAGKAVLCEKPMANTLEDARAMVEAAEQRGVYFEIGFELRHSKLYMKVKEWIDQGLLGQIVNTHCFYVSSAYWEKGSWRVRTNTCGSMFGEKLSHYVDLPRWWIGDEVMQVYAVCAPNAVPYYEIHDNYHATYGFRNGATSHLTFMMAPGATFRGDPLQNVVDQQLGDGHELRYFVQGTHGAAEACIFTRTIRRWRFNNMDTEFASDVVEELTWPAQEDHAYYHNTTDQTKEVVRRVSEGLPPVTPARDAYETTRLCFAAEASAGSGRLVSLDEFP